MKAMVNERYGPPEGMEMKEIGKPQINDDEILVKTHATSINMIDIIYRSGMMAMFGLVRLSTGLRKPNRQVLGFDFAGDIVEVGKNITKFKVGDKVYGGSRSGANAEYMTTTQKAIAKIPSNMSYGEAAGIPVVGLTALQHLRDLGGIKEGDEVLVYGATSGTGMYTVQLAKYFGAKVVAVASEKNREMVMSWGADEFIDYKSNDVTEMGRKYDLVADCVGKISFRKWKRLVVDEGIFLQVGSPTMSMIGFMTSMIGNKFRKKQIKSVTAEYKTEDLEFLAKVAEEGKLWTVIEKEYSFEELPQAHAQYETGRTVGKLIVNIINE